MHALRHAYCSALATAGLSRATLARITGHADRGFTLRAYARDGRDEAALVAAVLARAAEGRVRALVSLSVSLARRLLAVRVALVRAAPAFMRVCRVLALPVTRRPHLPKLRVAGSSPVVRSSESPA